jgi:DNA primase
MDIKQLLDRDGIKLKRESSREFSGPCPWCGGRDRLRVWPDEQGGGFWCRGCNRGGDMVRYHMLTTGKQYFDACYDLGAEPRFERPENAGHTFKKAMPPPMKWRNNAAEVVNQYHNTLLSEIGAPMRSWLTARGINERSVRVARLGLNTADRYFERKSWGMPEELNENGKPKTVWIPGGLVIPCSVFGEVIRIRVRRQAEEGSRYATVSGSSRAPMRLGRLNRVVVVESDLDAILISQTAGDLASASALGSVSQRPDADTHAFLKEVETILLALDYDEAGAAQCGWWSRIYGAKVKRWPVPKGKDPGEAYQSGIDIRKWILAGLK